jgi:hypothetical protein
MADNEEERTVAGNDCGPLCISLKGLSSSTKCLNASSDIRTGNLPSAGQRYRRLLRWSGTESTITEATIWPTVPAVDDRW